MKLYAYDTETMELIAVINGKSNEECERKAVDAGYAASDDIAWTYTPAFGAIDGLVETADTEEIE